MANENENLFFKPEDMLEGLRAAFAEHPLDGTQLPTLAVPIPESENSAEAAPPLPMPRTGMSNRELISAAIAEDVCHWEAPPLRELFRGDRQPPVLGDFPVEYVHSLAVIEFQVLQAGQLFGPPLDSEMLEIFSALRRRPDGRSMGFLHDMIWQAAALMLALRPLSQAEYEVILARLERSCRSFQMGPVSRNYFAGLDAAFGGGAPEVE